MMRRVRTSGRNRLPLARRLVETTVGTIIALAMVSTWHLQCFVVSGASMAETLLGQHRQLVCGDCGATFRCADEEPIMPGKRAVCPNCGNASQQLDIAPPISADGVVVNRSGFLFRSPQRWGLAAFRGPARTAQVYVKRIVGLPGETIELRHGDVYANGEIQRKTIDQLRAMAVLVHDSTHEPASSKSRWSPDEAQSGWRQSGVRFWHARSSIRESSEGASANSPTSQEAGYTDPPGSDERRSKEPPDWLTYHHQRRWNGETEEVPITDLLGYNQTWPITQWHLIRDLMVRCRVRTSPGGRVNWLLTDARSQFLVTLDFGNQIVAVVQDGLQIYQAALPAGLESEELLCEVALCDHQVLLALNGRETAVVAYRSLGGPLRPTTRPVAIGAEGNELEVWDLMLMRDVYYAAGVHGRGDSSQDRLADDEYFMLGDNSHHSGDSREWPHAGVAADNLLGKPFAAFPGLRAPDGGQFQVPDFSRFRYIH